MAVAAKLNQEYAYPDYAPSREQYSPKKTQVKRKSAINFQLMVVSAIGLVFLTGLFFIMTQAIITNRSDKITQTKAEILDLQNANDRLKLKIAELKSMNRIELIARNQLGMVSPQTGSIEYIAMSDTADLGQAAAAGDQVNQTAAGESEQHSVLQTISRLVSRYILGVTPAAAAAL